MKGASAAGNEWMNGLSSLAAGVALTRRRSSLRLCLGGGKPVRPGLLSGCPAMPICPLPSSPACGGGGGARQAATTSAGTASTKHAVPVSICWGREQGGEFWSAGPAANAPSSCACVRGGRGGGSSRGGAPPLACAPTAGCTSWAAPAAAAAAAPPRASTTAASASSGLAPSSSSRRPISLPMAAGTSPDLTAGMSWSPGSGACAAPPTPALPQPPASPLPPPAGLLPAAEAGLAGRGALAARFSFSAGAAASPGASRCCCSRKLFTLIHSHAWAPSFSKTSCACTGQAPGGGGGGTCAWRVPPSPPQTPPPNPPPPPPPPPPHLPEHQLLVVGAGQAAQVLPQRLHRALQRGHGAAAAVGAVAVRPEGAQRGGQAAQHRVVVRLRGRMRRGEQRVF